MRKIEWRKDGMEEKPHHKMVAHTEIEREMTRPPEMDTEVGRRAETPDQYLGRSASGPIPTAGRRRCRSRLQFQGDTDEDDPEAYLRAFKQMATMAGWPRYQWATILIPNLTGVTQAMVDTLRMDEIQQYD